MAKSQVMRTEFPLLFIVAQEGLLKLKARSIAQRQVFWARVALFRQGEF